MMKRFAALILGTALLAGCGAKALPQAAGVRAIAPSVKAKADVFQQDVVAGFTQIFKTYDTAPQDGRLSFGEFGHVVDREWFNAHDTNHDRYIPLDEWLTPTELASQVADIQAAGPELLKRADKDHDGGLSLKEFMDDAFEVDATPWLAEPADGNIKPDAFRKFADAQGKLGADGAVLMVGDLLARGYYLDGPDAQRLKLAPRK